MPARRSEMMPLEATRESARVVLPWSTWAIIVRRRVEEGAGSTMLSCEERRKKEWQAKYLSSLIYTL